MKVKRILVVGLALFLFLTPVAMASTDLYPFTSAREAARFQLLSSQFRCLVCQNETLADSNAPLAKDLRFQIYKMVKAGKSNEDITDFLVSRYGDFISFKPPVTLRTYLLWIGPFMMLLVSLIRLYWLISHRKREEQNKLTAAERRQLDHLLQSIFSEEKAA